MLTLILDGEEYTISKVKAGALGRRATYLLTQCDTDKECIIEVSNLILLEDENDYNMDTSRCSKEKLLELFDSICTPLLEKLFQNSSASYFPSDKGLFIGTKGIQPRESESKPT